MDKEYRTGAAARRFDCVAKRGLCSLFIFLCALSSCRRSQVTGLTRDDYDGCLMPCNMARPPFEADITTSPDSIDRFITYRLIPPGYEGWHRMGVYQRDLTSFEEVSLVAIDRPEQGCVNCHTSCWGDAKRTLYHRRGEGGGTVFTLGQKDASASSPSQASSASSLVNLKEAAGMQGSYPAWHPSGRYVAFASTDTHQGFYHKSRGKIEVYDLGGRIFVYDTEARRKVWEVGDSLHFCTFPTFSHDGRTLYFCRARAVSMPRMVDSLHYSLVAVDFESQCLSSVAACGGNPQAAREPELVTIDIPDGERKSVSHPRVSPDGRFLMYTVADCGTFPIWHPEADLAMIDLRTGLPVDVSALNSDCAEAYHVWSSNSRWVMFSSRRLDGRYTRLYFAHVDTAGRVSRPFPLPWDEPDHDVLLMDSYNVPDFKR